MGRDRTEKSQLEKILFESEKRQHHLENTKQAQAERMFCEA